MKQGLSRISVGVLLLLLSTIAGGCGDDSDRELTLSDYFQRLEQLSQDLQQEGQASDDEFEEALGLVADEETGELSQDAINTMVSLNQSYIELLVRFMDDLEATNPPAQVRDLHRELVAAGRDVTQAFQEIGDEMAGARSLAELEGTFSGVLDRLLAGGGEAFDDACLALQEIADANGIDIDIVSPLECRR